MFMRKIYLFFVIIFLLFSCKQENIIINHTSSEYEYLIASGNRIIKYKTDGSFENLINELPDEVNVIKYFRGNYYVLFKELQLIYVINEKKFDVVAKIDFFDDMLPIDICFPNATDAYIYSKESKYISIVDLTTFSLSNYKIPVSSIPISITGIGNQVYVCCKENNTINVIDTRVNEVVDTINTISNPVYISVDRDGEFVYVICQGNDVGLSAIQKISVTTREISSPLYISNSNDIIIYSIALSKKNIYIASDKYILRVPLLNMKSESIVLNRGVNRIKYDSILDEFYFIAKTDNINTLYRYNASTNKTIAKYNIVMDINDIIK